MLMRNDIPSDSIAVLIPFLLPTPRYGSHKFTAPDAFGSKSMTTNHAGSVLRFVEKQC